ncbi:nitrogen regulation protein NR(II) [Chitinibacteraceae bacterium HSL-7]
MPVHAFSGFELLDSAMLVTRQDGALHYCNAAACDLLTLRDDHTGQALTELLGRAHPLVAIEQRVRDSHQALTEYELEIPVHLGHAFVMLTASPLDMPGQPEAAVLLDVRQIDQQRRIVNEERLALQQQANRELIRNLAHEIKNPLGGIRGAAQLLALELPDESLKEYTDVIIGEAQRLQLLLDRLLTPHRLPTITELNIHEVLERVRTLVLAETPNGLAVKRDYDTSLPMLTGDREQLIQVVLNIVRNAVQAMNGVGEIRLRTRIARQATLNRKRFPLALMIQIVDNGPGIPESLRETLFYPLVSGKSGGTGIGLHLAHTFVTQHHGTIEFESVPGHTTFTILLPLNAWPEHA